MLTIGLTGGIGSGKTTVANLFASYGITIIDTDQIARDITRPGSPALLAISNHFGPTILQSDGSLNRANLRKIIFTHPDERKWLESVTHPLIRQEVQQCIQQASSAYCIVVIPLLFESTPNPLIQRVLVVDTPLQQQIVRTIERDNISQTEVEAILNAQVSREKRLALADDIIINDSDLSQLAKQVEGLHQKYLLLARM